MLTVCQHCLQALRCNGNKRNNLFPVLTQRSPESEHFLLLTVSYFPSPLFQHSHVPQGGPLLRHHLSPLWWLGALNQKV